MEGTTKQKDLDIFAGKPATRVPLAIYQDELVYRSELEQIFYGTTWNYVGLDCEVPKPGDFRRNYIGEREILMLRKDDGSISVVENRCAHRGAQLCQAQFGNVGTSIMCPYHQWTFDHDGNLWGCPSVVALSKGGLPKDFNLSDHKLNQLKVEVLNGVVFASFSKDTPLSPTILAKK